MSEFILTDKAVHDQVADNLLLDNSDFSKIKNSEDLRKILTKYGRDFSKVEYNISYEDQLRKLQAELIKFQFWIVKNKMRVAVLLEGRDAAGKGGTVKRFVEHLNPRSMRLVALAKPTELEKGQWYFRRYIKELPDIGEIVFFDRSWYNRAVVEPVMGFCNEEQYQRFMRQVSEFEDMLFEDGVHLIKFWFSIDKKEQARRFAARKQNPLKQWKLSHVDQKGQDMWDKYTYFKEQMFSRTHTFFNPWTIVKTNIKKEARLESIRFLLSKFEYTGKSEAATRVLPDPNVIMRFHKSMYNND